MHPAQFFRAGAGAIIVDKNGFVLVLERLKIPGAWQLPQGGLLPDEEPLQAAIREIAEETAIPNTELELLAAYPEPLAYELPPAAWSKKTGRGQVQYWFLFRFHGSDTSIDLEPGAEFRSWTWMDFATLLARVAEFRKPVYRRLGEHFRSFFAHPAIER